MVGIDEHGDVGEVLCGGADQRDAADVDLFDRFLERRAVARDGRLEGIEVHHDRPDARHAVFAAFALVRFVRAVGQDGAEDARVQRLDAAVEERRKTRQFADVFCGQPVFREVRARAAGRVELDVARDERTGQLEDAGSIVDRDERRFAELSRQAPVPRELRSRARPSRPRRCSRCPVRPSSHRTCAWRVPSSSCCA